MASFIMIALIVVTSLGATLMSLMLLAGLRRRAEGRSSAPPWTNAAEIVFLFAGRTLVDASPLARDLLGDRRDDTDDLGRFMLVLEQRFPGIEAALESLPRTGHFALPEQDGSASAARIEGDLRDDTMRIAIVGPADRPGTGIEARHFSQSALASEVATLRGISEHAPWPTWKQRADGRIVWANRAYLDLARLEGSPAVSWPLPVLFRNLVPLGPRDAAVPPGTQRIHLPAAEGEPLHWFDLRRAQVGEDTIFFAIPIDGLVRAETNLSEFVQTLTKTFAHLTIGLAIFDRKRQLALFNPALLDMTALPPQFLSGRPTLASFLDALRDRQRIPEPKDYKSWRLHIAELEAAASDGSYHEVWHLPNGQILRVSGRPHSDGAIAYLFEDISTEFTLSRSYRAEIETGQAVLDSLDDAIAVFSQSGTLNMVNAAYVDLWKTDPESSPGEFGIVEATRHWQSMCQPNPIWGDLREYVLDLYERDSWDGDVLMADGTRLVCDVKPLNRGATLVQFSRPAQPAAGETRPNAGRVTRPTALATRRSGGSRAG